VDGSECNLHSYGHGHLYDQQLYGDGIGWRGFVRGVGDTIEQERDLWEFSDLYGDNERGLYGLCL
jgi:hypothetical protein